MKDSSVLSRAQRQCRTKWTPTVLMACCLLQVASARLSLDFRPVAGTLALGAERITVHWAEGGLSRSTILTTAPCLMLSADVLSWAIKAPLSQTWGASAGMQLCEVRAVVPPNGWSGWAISAFPVTVSLTKRLGRGPLREGVRLAAFVRGGLGISEMYNWGEVPSSGLLPVASLSAGASAAWRLGGLDVDAGLWLADHVASEPEYGTAVETFAVGAGIRAGCSIWQPPSNGNEASPP